MPHTHLASARYESITDPEKIEAQPNFYIKFGPRLLLKHAVENQQRAVQKHVRTCCWFAPRFETDY